MQLKEETNAIPEGLISPREAKMSMENQSCLPAIPLNLRELSLGGIGGVAPWV